MKRKDFVLVQAFVKDDRGQNLGQEKKEGEFTTGKPAF